MHNTTTLRYGALALALGLGGLVGACSNDDSSSSSRSLPAACRAEVKLEDAVAGVPTPNDSANATPAELAAFKAGYPAVTRAITALDAALPTHPTAVTKLLDQLKAIGRTGDPSGLDSIDGDAMGAYFYEHCDDQNHAITAKEYEYDGGTAAIKAGAVRVQLTNGGTQLHEMVLLRRNDGVTQSFKDLLALGDAAQSKAKFINATVSEQGKASYLSGTLTPGSYAMVCFIPDGTTSFAQLQGGSSGGAPHFTKGMIREFTVK
jgi:hypothetical protein